MCVAQLKFRNFEIYVADVVSVVCGVWCVLRVLIPLHGVIDGTWKYDGGQVEQLIDPQPAEEIPGIHWFRTSPNRPCR